MEHPKCRTCKYFRPKDKSNKYYSWEIPPDFGTCGKVIMSDIMTMPVKTDKGIKHVIRPEYKTHLASVMDGSSYHAQLDVHPDFYCAMHSELS